MTYLLRHSGTGSIMLVEMTTREAREAISAKHPDGVRFELCDANRAHKWVRDGGLHSTTLWVDDENRIRKAK